MGIEMAWNADDFRRNMRARAERAESDARAHRGREINRAPNAMAGLADEYRGEAVICDTLATSNATSVAQFLRVIEDSKDWASRKDDWSKNMRDGYVAVCDHLLRNLRA